MIKYQVLCLCFAAKKHPLWPHHVALIWHIPENVLCHAIYYLWKFFPIFSHSCYFIMCNSYFWFYLPLRPDDLFHRPMQLQQSFIIYLKEILVWLVIQKSNFYEEKSIFLKLLLIFLLPWGEVMKSLIVIAVCIFPSFL